MSRRLFNFILSILFLLFFAGTSIAQQKYEVKDIHGKMGLSCATCHGDKNPPQAPETATCLTCHKSYAEVSAKTNAIKPNPHDSHKGEVACSDCHSTHGTSRLMCNDCHSFTGFKMK